jgi:glycosyltransferase involved in cell wall biosynthesis
MQAVIKKPRVLMVGAFPPRRFRKIYGGQVTACMCLLDSTFIADHAVRTLDTTQISNPPPSFIIRLLLAAKRFFVFGMEVLLHKPDAAIFFLADGASAFEKGLLAIMSRFLRIRVIVFPRAGNLIRQYDANRLFAAFIRCTLGRADMFLCQGLVFQAFATQKLGFNHESAPIIPNWTALQTHLDIGKSRVYGKIPARVNLLFLGWLEESKGIFDLLEAVRILRDQNIAFHLTLGGDGNAMSEVRRFVELHGLTGYVTLAGWVDEEAKRDLLGSCDIFVLPSWIEGLPNAMIEAMSAGSACVVTKVGAIGDYVTDGHEALVIKHHNPTELAEAIKILALNHPLRDNLGQNGHRLAVTQFSLVQGAQRMSEAVSQVMTPQTTD